MALDHKPSAGLIFFSFVLWWNIAPLYSDVLFALELFSTIHRRTHLQQATTALSNCFIVVGALRITRQIYTHVWIGALISGKALWRLRCASDTRAQLINCDLIIKYKFKFEMGRGELLWIRAQVSTQSCKSLNQNSSWQPDLHTKT